VVGLDHLPVAVANLDEAAARYLRLGFVLKPGRPHANGIRNQHAKFADGTEIELITAPDARDALTATYRRHLALGDGPAFLALFAPSLEEAAARLDAAASRDHPRSLARAPGVALSAVNRDNLVGDESRAGRAKGAREKEDQ
jgi:hypothetical protein